MGGAYGGHYYAFVKSYEDNKWYKFDDTNVTELDPEEIPARCFGGGPSGNAYMMMYRQIESADDVPEKVLDDDIPVYLK